MNFRYLFCIFFLTINFSGYGQLPNEVFYDADSLLENNDKRTLDFSLRSMGFTKNNEYFNRIADGYTIFGAQLNPYFRYAVSDNFSLDVGAYLQQDFGTPGLKIFQPFFTFRTEYLGFDILIGTIDGRLNHRLIEPLFDFERILFDGPEQGVQFRHISDDWFADIWVDWETMIYSGDPKQEEIYGGVSLVRNFEMGNNNRFFVPVQGLVYHKGGAIDSSPNPLQTMINGALGLGMEFTSSRVLKSFEPSVYYAYFRDFSVSRKLDYRDGRGWYANVMAEFNHGIKIMLSYWDASEFISLTGGKIYPSVSSTYKKPYVVKPSRKILILRFMQDIHLGSGIYLTTRIEPFYDFELNRIEFSHGFYINFRDRIRLWQEK